MNVAVRNLAGYVAVKLRDLVFSSENEDNHDIHLVKLARDNWPKSLDT